jgi:peptidoglycan/xylan/chitin deacetylase (PgdA/CDA1 family)
LYLPALAEASRLQEALRSRRDLEDALGRDVRWFAYPFGAWDAASRAAVRRAGFDGALTCDPRALVEGEDVYAVPRIEVRCDSVGEFERLINGIFE